MTTVGLIMFIVQYSNASDIEHVNVGRVAVDSQSVSEQQVAGRTALEQVFIKTSGNVNVIQTPEINRAVNNYEQFLIASSYQQVKEQLFFEAIFSREKVEQLLMASGQSVWTSLRPNGVIWLINEDEDGNKMTLSHGADNPELDIIERQAFARGVDIVVPLGDIEDALSLSVYDLWNQHLNKIIEYSQRYQTEYVISSTLQPYTQAEHKARQNLELSFDADASDIEYSDIQDSGSDVFSNQVQEVNADLSPDNAEDMDIYSDDIKQTSTENQTDLAANEEPKKRHQASILNVDIPDDTAYKLDFIITNSDKVERGVIYSNNRDSAISQLIDEYANLLAAEFATDGNVNEATLTSNVQVNGIDSFTDYIQLMSVFNAVPSVNEARLVSLNKSNAHIMIKHGISIKQLSSILALDPRLRLQEANGSNDNNAWLTNLQDKQRNTEMSLSFLWLE